MKLSLVCQTALRHFGAKRVGSVVQGLRGGALGFRVELKDGSAGWLRIQWLERNATNRFYWNGYPAASLLISHPVMPQVFGWQDWHDKNNSYRAILLEYVGSPVIQPNAHPQFAESWWHSLIQGLDSLSFVQTKRQRLTGAFINSCIFKEYGIKCAQTINRWVTAHGDLHWGNLTAPELRLLDWEAWGTAPEGFDISRLIYFSLDHAHLRAELLRRFEQVIRTTDFANSLLFQFAARRRGTRLHNRPLNLRQNAVELERYLLDWAKAGGRDHNIGHYLSDRDGTSQTAASQISDRAAGQPDC